jgi:hypothetical protein
VTDPFKDAATVMLRAWLARIDAERLRAPTAQAAAIAAEMKGESETLENLESTQTEANAEPAAE